MTQRRVQIVILCEDKQQEVFARYFLKKRGFNLEEFYLLCREDPNKSEAECGGRQLLQRGEPPQRTAS